MPRDRNGSFEPELVKKRQRRLAGFDEKVLALYARGQSTREIQGVLEELYGAEVSPTLISNVTEGVLEELQAWQTRPLSTLYPILYFDALVVKSREDGPVKNKSVYLALGINLEGEKELLGMWIAANEGAKFWLQVFTELTQNLSPDQLRFISEQVGPERTLLICCGAFRGKPELPNLTVKKIPQAVLARCEWGRDDYSLNVTEQAPVVAASEAKAEASSNSGTKPKAGGRKKLPAMQELPLFANLNQDAGSVRRSKP